VVILLNYFYQTFLLTRHQFFFKLLFSTFETLKTLDLLKKNNLRYFLVFFISIEKVILDKAIPIAILFFFHIISYIPAHASILKDSARTTK